jgi:hypothetical protein
MKEIVIPADQAVFWLDGRGRWRNASGPFRNPRIIEHFHRSIRLDAHGYHLRQERDGLVEKVYFRCEDTALFVREVILAEPLRLLLNTRQETPLEPERLFVENDQLYLETAAGERVRFSEQALMALADLLEVTEEGYWLRLGGRRVPIAHRPTVGAERWAPRGPRRR